MNTKKQVLLRLQQVISEHLGVPAEEINEESTWTELRADSLDRLELSLAVEEAFKVHIPHHIGEQLNTVRETLDHVLTLIAAQEEAAISD